ncbi:cobalt-precorrin-5B (C(1))-methyltransferase [Tropicimonas isoalkanivorans]|uniref:Cobalt-precorrin-5B C(1)-methyltransferase n=1 Tax=Tropicimonas isoalkanivorans TaxID=441112 RepID=A0A1I1LMW2_9RHOB|nr:cobalt-precorrin-5B (C(1))-methyltransferase [Tropicimonas isoalkanivorans]SFC70810.1 cobalt-precorrin-5B (C1)-methyltransferase [Tropicimonas isoalkanivorans]
MTRIPEGPLRTGFTTGACATAAAAAACGALLTGEWADPVEITLPRGQRVAFPLSERDIGEGWARAVVVKDAGDDPDVTHGARITATLRHGAAGQGIVLRGGEGVGTVTRPGLPVPVGEPAINPVPRQMITQALTHLADARGVPPDFDVEISVPGGAALAEQTWNPRLGIVGGLSILGTTGIVRPFSCAAWIASIHRGIDVARAAGLPHVVGSTGATSEKVAQQHFGLPDHAMLDMGDFAGGMLKYLARHPVPRVTVAGGFGKLTKLAQGAMDLHSARSQVDFDRLAETASTLGADRSAIAACNTASQALSLVGPPLAMAIAEAARDRAAAVTAGKGIAVDVLMIDRAGNLVALADANGARAS